MPNNEYTKQNLLQLLEHSGAYKKLSPEKKQSIQKHLDSNNKPVLMYIYYQLLKEQQISQKNRDKLAKKIIKAEDKYSDSIKDRFSGQS